MVFQGMEWGPITVLGKWRTKITKCQEKSSKNGEPFLNLYFALCGKVFNFPTSFVRNDMTVFCLFPFFLVCFSFHPLTEKRMPKYQTNSLCLSYNNSMWWKYLWRYTLWLFSSQSISLYNINKFWVEYWHFGFWTLSLLRN